MAHSRATTPRKKKRPLPDVAHAADRAAYPSRTTVKFWCGPVEAIRRNSSLAETSLTYPLRKCIEALDGRHKRRWRYEKSIQGVKRALLKKTKVIFILVAVHAARSATNVVFFSLASADLSLNENGLHNNNGTTLVVCYEVRVVRGS